MALSSELISELVKVTNTRRSPATYDNTVYGTIVDDGAQQYAKIDGSEALTPIATTVELNSGDRVVVTIKNHTATVMGNTTSPAINVMTAGNLRSEISQQADRITLAVEDIGKIQSELTLTAGEISSIVKRVGDAETSITQNADSISYVVKRVGDAESDINTFTEFKQTVEGFSFMGGDVKISGGDLILDGCITWADLSSDVQTSIDNAAPRYQFSVDGVNDWHETMTSADKYRRDSTDGGNTWGDPYQFRGTDGQNGANGSDADVTYANIVAALDKAGSASATYISKNEITSPTIYGGSIYGSKFYGGEFSIINNESNSGVFNIRDKSGGYAFEIKYWYGDAGDAVPTTMIDTPWGGILRIGGTNGQVEFVGQVKFDGASVTGLTATFG